MTSYEKLALSVLFIAGMFAACQQPHAPAPITSVEGAWLFTGEVNYGGATSCADTMTMLLSQAGTAVRGESTDWRFTCDGAPAVGPRLIAAGIVERDALELRWATDSGNVLCTLCIAFIMTGQVTDSVLSGRYTDMLGGSGSWEARKAP